ncbi:MAG: pilus assembly PilX N-terminal domain-containing protein [Desulfohalobiaceae bacterium]|nr:pilus assembly PilX N-terminal domain-containing protein [Desulfohalobiaceae bacterium]
MRTILRNEDEYGSVLVSGMFILVILSVLGTAAMNTSNTELFIVRNDKLHKQAFYLAESGIEHAKANIIAGNNTTPIPSTLSVGNYNATWTSLTDEYLVNSTGQVENAVVKLQAAFGKPSISPYGFGVFGNSTITISGNPVVDSYNSTLGYGSSGGGTSGHIAVNNNANGSITINGNKAAITGNATVGPGGNVNSTIDDKHGGIQGSKFVNSNVIEFPPPSYPCSGATAISYSLSENSEEDWGSNTYHYDAMDIKGELNISGETTICVNTLDIKGQINIDSGAKAKIYVTGSMDAAGQGLVNSNGDPSSLQIFGTSSTSSIKLAGKADYYGTVYAPTAEVSVTGQGDVYGSLVGNNVKFSGQGSMHYDINLGDISFATSGDLSLVYWKEIFEE